MNALSIRQPWAWLIVNGFKPIENRTWACKYRGPLLIHASSTMSKDEWQDCHDFSIENGVTIPNYVSLSRDFRIRPGAGLGGIVGKVEMMECVSTSENTWFVGPYGFRFENPKPLPFFKIRGALGLFEIMMPLEIEQSYFNA